MPHKPEMAPDNNPYDEANDKASYMSPLSALTNKVISWGYTETFNATRKGLQAASTSAYYTPEQVQIVDFYRFEGESDPGDESIIYVIETSDGKKGMLVDAYGVYADGLVNEFVKQVQDIAKQKATSDLKPGESPEQEG